VMAVAVILVISRRPDLVMHAHFYAEDGAVWYADAYNLGWVHALTLTAGGYLNTLQRLVGALSLLVPIRYAPLVRYCRFSFCSRGGVCIGGRCGYDCGRRHFMCFCLTRARLIFCSPMRRFI